MEKQTRWFVWAILLAASMAASVSWAGPPWKKLIPFRRQVEADPSKSYQLTENEGPWMILAASFAGPGAEQQAHELVLELRKRYGLPAYMHRRKFDYTEPVYGLGVDKYGHRKRMRYLNNTKFDEIAVLVGNYPSVESPEAQEDLHRIKTAKPDCLDIKKRGKKTAQRFIGLRELQRLVHADPEARTLGPMRRAFIGRNPLLPREFFVPDTIDPLIVEMNRNVEHSLLKNPGRYTVKVATFHGEVRFVGEKGTEEDDSNTRRILGIPIGKKHSKLELAAIKAHKLTEALRKRGVEAYEYHDRTSSIVTVGSFQFDGTPQPNGTKLINPQMLKVIKEYSPQKEKLPGQSVMGLKPRVLEGIPFDVQPVPMAVPKVSRNSGMAVNR